MKTGLYSSSHGTRDSSEHSLLQSTIHPAKSIAPSCPTGYRQRDWATHRGNTQWLGLRPPKYFCSWSSTTTPGNQQAFAICFLKPQVTCGATGWSSWQRFFTLLIYTAKEPMCKNIRLCSISPSWLQLISSTLLSITGTFCSRPSLLEVLLSCEHPHPPLLRLSSQSSKPHSIPCRASLHNLLWTAPPGSCCTVYTAPVWLWYDCSHQLSFLQLDYKLLSQWFSIQPHVSDNTKTQIYSISIMQPKFKL